MRNPKAPRIFVAQVLVVDEIGTLDEAKAARTIGERGVQLLVAWMS